MATIAPLPNEILADLDFPQREAAFFYWLFLRGNSPEQHVLAIFENLIGSEQKPGRIQ